MRYAIAGLSQCHSDNGSVIQKIENFKHYSDPTVKTAIKGNGLTFCFDEKGILIRVDHWLNDLSPIYKKINEDGNN